LISLYAPRELKRWSVKDVKSPQLSFLKRVNKDEEIERKMIPTYVVDGSVAIGRIVASLS